MYIYKNTNHTNLTLEYMKELGMDDEQIQSVLNQAEFEKNDAIIREKQRMQSIYEKESDHLFLEAQYDGTEESMQIWRDKVTEIKSRK